MGMYIIVLHPSRLTGDSRVSFSSSFRGNGSSSSSRNAERSYGRGEKVSGLRAAEPALVAVLTSRQTFFGVALAQAIEAGTEGVPMTRNAFAQWFPDYQP